MFKLIKICLRMMTGKTSDYLRMLAGLKQYRHREVAEHLATKLQELQRDYSILDAQRDEGIQRETELRNEIKFLKETLWIKEQTPPEVHTVEKVIEVPTLKMTEQMYENMRRNLGDHVVTGQTTEVQANVMLGRSQVYDYIRKHHTLG